MKLDDFFLKTHDIPELANENILEVMCPGGCVRKVQRGLKTFCFRGTKQ